MALLSKSTFVLLAALVAVMFIVPLAKVPSETHSIVAEEMATQGLEDLELARPGGLSSPARNLPEGHDSKEKRLRRDLELDPMPAFRNPCFSGRRRSWRPGKCADDNAWLVPWMTKRPNSNWTLIDVGANKGYVIAGWLETLLGRDRTRFTPHNLGVSIYSNNNITSNIVSMCGGCQECVEPPAHVAADHRASSVKVYAFEPSIANFKWLSFFFDDPSVVNLTNAAVSFSPGTAYFPNDVLGKETGKVVSTPQDGFVPVKIVSLDAYLGRQLPFIDVLSTDAEGFDQDVAKGARGFIAAGRVGVYQFEMYRQEDYKSIFEQLFEWGYVCYYFTEMRGTTAKASVPWLIRISQCWHDEYQRYIGWVNGLCYNRRVPHLKDIFEGLELKRHRNTGPSLSKSRARVMHFINTYVRKHSD